MLLGIVFFIDAPLSIRDGVVTGKTGRVHTMDQFRVFRLWERAYLVVALAFAAICIAGVIQHYRRTGSLRVDAPPRPPKAPPTT